MLLGFGSTAGVLYAYFTLIDEVGAGRAALVTYLGPDVSLLMGALLLGETITASAVAGVALILVGVASRPERPDATPPSVPCCEGMSTGHPAAQTAGAGGVGKGRSGKPDGVQRTLAKPRQDRRMRHR